MNIRNFVSLIGNLGSDPEIRTFDSGVKKGKFSLATSKKYKNKAGEQVEETQWHTVVVWGNMADAVGKFLKKGSTVSLTGELTYREYTDKDGNKRYLTEIVMDQFVPHSYEKKSEPAPTPKPDPVASANDYDDQDVPF